MWRSRTMVRLVQPLAQVVEQADGDLGVLAQLVQEVEPVKRQALGRLDGGNSRGAWTVGEERHFAERSTGADRPHRLLLTGFVPDGDLDAPAGYHEERDACASFLQD